MSTNTVTFDGQHVCITTHSGEVTKKLPEEILSVETFLEYITSVSKEPSSKLWRVRHFETDLDRKYQNYLIQGNLERAILLSKQVMGETRWDRFILSIQSNSKEFVEDFFRIFSTKLTLGNLQYYLQKEYLDVIQDNDTLWIERVKNFKVL